MKFAAAYEQSRDAVYGYLMYMTRDTELAEDLSQEVFLRMFLHLGKFREESSVRTWALSIARNVFLSYAKRKLYPNFGSIRKGIGSSSGCLPCCLQTLWQDGLSKWLTDD